MAQTLRINGHDAHAEWGAYLLDGGVSALMAPAGAKSLVTNESRLEDGKRTVATDKSGNSLMRLSARDVTLPLAIRADGYGDLLRKQQGLIGELMKGKAEVETGELPGVTFRLDYVSCTQYSQLRGGLAKFSIKFNEPNPNDR